MFTALVLAFSYFSASMVLWLPPPPLASSRWLLLVRYVTGSGGSAHLVMKGRRQSVVRRMYKALLFLVADLVLESAGLLG